MVFRSQQKSRTTKLDVQWELIEEGALWRLRIIRTIVPNYVFLDRWRTSWQKVYGLRSDADERLSFAAISRGRESLTCIEPNRSIGSLNGLRDTLLLLIDVQCLIHRNVHFGY